MKLASVRLIARDIRGLVAFYETVTGAKADWLAPVFAEIVTRGASLAIQERCIHMCIVANYTMEESVITTVSSADPMITQHPDVSGAGARGDRNRRDHLVVRIVGAIEDHVYLSGGEPCQLSLRW